MEQIIGIIGVVLAVFGIALTYLAHPDIIRRIRSNPQSFVGRVSQMAFLGRQSVAPPDKISLYEIIFDREYKQEIDAVFRRMGAETEGYVRRLVSQTNCTFLFEPAFKDDLRCRKLSFAYVIVAIVAELAAHVHFLSTSTRVEDREIGLRIGYFVTFSKQEDLISLHRICEIEQEISGSVKWSEARDAYFVARMIPFRHVLSSNPTTLMTKVDITISVEAASNLRLAVMRYLIASPLLGRTVRVANCNLASKIDDCMSMIEWELLQAKLHRKEIDLQIIITNIELSISYAHKVIFGKSAMSDSTVVSRDVYAEIEGNWVRSSSRLLGAASRPPISEPPRSRGQERHGAAE